MLTFAIERVYSERLSKVLAVVRPVSLRLFLRPLAGVETGYTRPRKGEARTRCQHTESAPGRPYYRWPLKSVGGLMPCSTPAPATGTPSLLPGDRLEEIDTTLYHLQHMCALLSAFAGQPGQNIFTDGLRIEMFAVIFGWIGDELHDARLSLGELHREIAS